MKKLIFVLFVIALSIAAMSCEKDNDKQIVPPPDPGSETIVE